MTTLAIILAVAVIISGWWIVFLRREIAFAGRLNKWEKERFELIAEVFKWAATMTALPNHQNEFKEAAGGNIAYQGTMLNFATLKEMTLHMVEIEGGRVQIIANLKVALNAVNDWQIAHPQPLPPFGRWRISVTPDQHGPKPHTAGQPPLENRAAIQK